MRSRPRLGRVLIKSSSRVRFRANRTSSRHGPRTESDPNPGTGRIEIPQYSGLRPHRSVLSLGRKPRRGRRRPFDDSERFKPFVDISRFFAEKWHHWALPRRIAQQALFSNKWHHGATYALGNFAAPLRLNRSNGQVGPPGAFEPPRLRRVFEIVVSAHRPRVRCGLVGHAAKLPFRLRW